MERAKAWSEAVEEAYRFQSSGWRDAVEFRSTCGDEVERWPETNWVKKLPVKGTKNWHYFSKSRECGDKDLMKVKLYTYA